MLQSYSIEKKVQIVQKKNHPFLNMISFAKMHAAR